ncbi:hypothetical protein GEMRC1_007673 [Eukaryota sp. GEM-RC1]
MFTLDPSDDLSSCRASVTYRAFDGDGKFFKNIITFYYDEVNNITLRYLLDVLRTHFRDTSVACNKPLPENPVLALHVKQGSNWRDGTDSWLQAKIEENSISSVTSPRKPTLEIGLTVENVSKEEYAQLVTAANDQEVITVSPEELQLLHPHLSAAASIWGEWSALIADRKAEQDRIPPLLIRFFSPVAGPQRRSQTHDFELLLQFLSQELQVISTLMNSYLNDLCDRLLMRTRNEMEHSRMRLASAAFLPENTRRSLQLEEEAEDPQRLSEQQL